MAPRDGLQNETTIPPPLDTSAACRARLKPAMRLIRQLVEEEDAGS